MDRSPTPVYRIGRLIAGWMLGIAAMIPAMILGSLLQRGPAEAPSIWLTGATNHGGMTIGAITLIALLARGRWESYGFRLPRRGGILAATILGAGISAAAALAERSLPGNGLEAVLGKPSFLEQVILVWIVASVAEEIVSRGLVQSFLSPLEGIALGRGPGALDLPIIAGALFFAASHLPLLMLGVDRRTVAQIVVFAFAVGLVAGSIRKRSGSLIPAILVHAAANATGSLIESIF